MHPPPPPPWGQPRSPTRSSRTTCSLDLRGRAQPAALRDRPPKARSQETVCNRFALSNLIQDQFVTELRDGQRRDGDRSRTSRRSSSNLDQQLGQGRRSTTELAKNDLTRDDLTELARQVLLFRQVQTVVAEPSSATTSCRKHVREGHPPVHDGGRASTSWSRPKAEATDVYEQVTAPGATEKNFEDLAKEVSTDPSAKRRRRAGSAPASQVRAGVRGGRRRARARRDLQARQDRVRLARDPPDRQAGHPVRGGQGADGAEPGRLGVHGLAPRPGRRGRAGGESRYGRYDVDTLSSVDRQHRSQRHRRTGTATTVPPARDLGPLARGRAARPRSRGSGPCLRRRATPARPREGHGPVARARRMPVGRRADPSDAGPSPAGGDARTARGDRRRRRRRDPRRARRCAAAGGVPRADRRGRGPVGRRRRRRGSRRRS